MATEAENLAGIERAQRWAGCKYRLDTDDLQEIALAYMEAVAEGYGADQAVSLARRGVYRRLSGRQDGIFPPSDKQPALVVSPRESNMPSTPAATRALEVVEVWAHLPRELWPVARLWAQDYTDAEAAEELGVTDRTIRRWRVRCADALEGKWP
jgi:hypothetical protein